MTDKTAATLTIHRAEAMGRPGRQLIALWLRRQAAALEEEGDNYSKRFTARYRYNEQEKE